MSSLQDEQYTYELNRDRAEKTYFDQLKEEGIPCVVGSSMLLNAMHQPGPHTAEEICTIINTANTTHKISKLLAAKFLNYQHILGNVTDIEPGKYELYLIEPWFGLT